MKEINLMKYLKIEQNKGYYRDWDNNWVELDKISKDDLMSLLDNAINEDFEMDPFDVSILGNKAHQIIYKNLFDKFNELLENKNRFKDECEQLYRKAIQRYKKDTH